MQEKCKRESVRCLCRGEEGTPAHFLTSRKRTRSPKAAEQSRHAARQRRVDVTLQEAAQILTDQNGRGVVTYKGHVFTRVAWKESPHSGKRGGIFGAKKFIKSVLEAAEQK